MQQLAAERKYDGVGELIRNFGNTVAFMIDGEHKVETGSLVESLVVAPPHRVHGTAVFMMAPGSSAPVALLHHLKHNQVLHERVVLLTLLTEEVPRIKNSERLTVTAMPIGFTKIVAHYGYMESADVPKLLELAELQTDYCLYDPMSTSFYLGKESLSAPFKGKVMMNLLLQLFIWLHKNELDSTTHFGIPPNRVVELGARLDLVPRSGHKI